MARHPTQTHQPDLSLAPHQLDNIQEMADASNALAVITDQNTQNAQAIAVQFGYDGILSIGNLEDEIRFYQRRTVEACLELGKRLIILKELTPHGEFKTRLELLSVNDRMARKFMSATLKFSKANSSSLLKASGTQTKLLELVILDDDEIEALENGGTVRGLNLDAIETMSVSELKKALRKKDLELQSKDAVIAKKDQKLNQLDQELAAVSIRQAHIAWPEAFQGYQTQINALRAALKNGLGGLDILTKDAMAITPASEAEELSLTNAKENLATEMVNLHNEAAEMLTAIGLSFDKSLGAYTDARINLLNL